MHWHDEGPLLVLSELPGVSCISSRLLCCPESLQSLWRCATGAGEASSLRELQCVQITLRAAYLDDSVVRVFLRKHGEPLEYSSYCVFFGAERMGPYLFGEGFPAPPIDKARHFVIVPCKDVEASLSFCEWFVCTLAVAPHDGRCRTARHVVRIEKSLDWSCALSAESWSKALARATRCSGATLTRPAWAAALPGPCAQYLGSLVGLRNLRGTCVIWIKDSATVRIPLTTSFAVLPVLQYVPGTGPPGASQALLDEYVENILPGAARAPPSPLLECKVTWAGNIEDALRSAKTRCAVLVRGTGALDGSLLAKTGRALAPMRLALVKGQATLGAVLARVEYEILSGLLEIDAESSGRVSISVLGLQVLCPPKRFRSAVQLNGYNAWPARAGVPWGRVRVSDLKVLGAWVDESDGPETLAPGSRFTDCLFHAAGSSIKLGASSLRFRGITLLQGNAGGCVNVGCGGRLPAPMKDARARGVFVQRVCHADGQARGLGALVTSGNVCTGGSVEGCTVSEVIVPYLGGSLTETGELRGPNVYWRVCAVGFSPAESTRSTRMDDIRLLYIAPDFPPIGPEASRFFFYVEGRATRDAELGDVYLALPAATGEARRVYSETACRICVFPSDPLRKDYFVCANGGRASSGVDSIWLQGKCGQDVAPNVEILNVKPGRVLCPRRSDVISRADLARCQLGAGGP